MENLLQQKTNELPFSQELKNILNQNGIENLEDLLQVEVYNWHKYPGFNMHHQHEIITYITNNNLHQFLKED